MADPVAQKAPYVVDLVPGTYWWCTCGHSKTQPFCDGTHKTLSGFAPIKLELTAASQVYLCGCKHSANKLLCDGSHKRL